MEAIQTLRDTSMLNGEHSAHSMIEAMDTQVMIVDEEVNTEEGTHTFTFDKKRQRLYAFLPKSCRMTIYKET